MLRHRVFVCALLVCTVVASHAYATFSTFAIGNSLTGNSRVAAMASMAGQRGTSASADYHMRTGVGLDYIWAHPSEVYPGTTPFPTALTNEAWNAITLQPFLSTVPTDTTSIVNFMGYARQQNAGNADAQFYIFDRWAQRTAFEGLGISYEEAFEKPYDGGQSGNDDPTARAAFFEQLLAQVRASQPQDMKPVLVIPTGYVFAEIDRRIRSGQLTGLTSIVDLYADAIHVNSLGGFVASATFYATIFSDDPTGLVPPPAYFSGLDPSVVNQLEGIIWDVVTSTPYTGDRIPGDCNLDGKVTIADLGELANNWQSTDAFWRNGDFNYDRAVTISDLGDLASNWQVGVSDPSGMSFEQALASVGLGGAGVPEPGSLGAVAATMLLLARRRA